MAKNGDYLVWAVCFNKEHTHIDSVKVGVFQDDKVINMEKIFTRQDCVRLINGRNDFYTIFKKLNETSWSIGKKIQVFKVNGKDFLKTEANNKAEDNLDNLPEFKNPGLSFLGY